MNALILLMSVLLTIEISPTDIKLPLCTGDSLSFNFTIDEPNDVNSLCIVTTLIVEPNDLTLDVNDCKSIAEDESYWLYGNHAGPIVRIEDGNYLFTDRPKEPPYAIVLYEGDIIARYSFVWDGTTAQYTFIIDPNINNSHVIKDDLTYEPIELADFVIKIRSPDLNDDCIVNLYDLAILSEHWLEEK